MENSARRRFTSGLLVSLLCAVCAAQGTDAPRPLGEDERLASVLKRVGKSVGRYHAGMFHIAFKETWRREELAQDFSTKKSKVFVYENVVLREPDAGEEGGYFGKVLRRLRTEDGKPARAGQRGREEPPPTAGAVLTFLLPRPQTHFTFTLEGEEVSGGHRAYRLGYRARAEGEAQAVWEGRSFRASAPKVGASRRGRRAGRLKGVRRD